MGGVFSQYTSGVYLSDLEMGAVEVARSCGNFLGVGMG